MPRKKQEVPTVRIPSTLPIGMVEIIDKIIKEDMIYKNRSDFMEKAVFMMVEKIKKDKETEAQ